MAASRTRGSARPSSACWAQGWSRPAPPFGASSAVAEQLGAESGATALELRGIHKRYPSRDFPVLRELEFVVARGSVAFVGGDNGVGKTTLLRLITGVVAPDDGTIRVLGLDPAVARREVQRLIGFAAAGNAGLYSRLTVAQHLDIWARVAFVPKALHHARIRALVERFHLGELTGQRSDRISMGQRQRLRLAMALVGEPELVLLDEPLTSLDAIGRAVLAGALDAITDRGGAVVWCSPDRSDVPVHTVQAYRLADGQLHPTAA